MSLRKRFRLFFTVAVIVAALVLLKAGVHALGFEFLTLNDLIPSTVMSAVFLIGFLLSSILSDYKEAERMPADIRMALEAIHDDIFFFAQRTPNVDVAGLRKILVGIVAALEEGLAAKNAHGHLKSATERVDELSPVFAHMEALGISQNLLVRMRSQQDVLRRCLFRIAHIQKMQFVPSAYVLVQTLVAAVLFLLLFLKTEGSYETALIFGFVSYMFVYALHLIAALEQPFRKGEHSVDDVSLFLLREFAEKIGHTSEKQ